MPEPLMADLLLALDAPARSGPSMLEGIVPLLVFAAIFYFLLYRPQAKKQQEHDAMVAAIKKDDRVVMQSGLHGKVVEVGADTVVIEAGSKTRLTFDKASVARKVEGPVTESAA